MTPAQCAHRLSPAELRGLRAAGARPGKFCSHPGQPHEYTPPARAAFATVLCPLHAAEWGQRAGRLRVVGPAPVLRVVRPMKIARNLSTPEMRAYWESVDRTAAEVDAWPAWKRAGLSHRDDPCACCGSTAGVEFMSLDTCQSCGLRHSGPREVTP